MRQAGYRIAAFCFSEQECEEEIAANYEVLAGLDLTIEAMHRIDPQRPRYVHRFGRHRSEMKERHSAEVLRLLEYRSEIVKAIAAQERNLEHRRSRA